MRSLRTGEISCYAVGVASKPGRRTCGKPHPRNHCKSWLYLYSAQMCTAANRIEATKPESKRNMFVVQKPPARNNSMERWEHASRPFVHMLPSKQIQDILKQQWWRTTTELGRRLPLCPGFQPKSTKPISTKQTAKVSTNNITSVVFLQKKGVDIFFWRFLSFSGELWQSRCRFARVWP